MVVGAAQGLGGSGHGTSEGPQTPELFQVSSSVENLRDSWLFALITRLKTELVLHNCQQGRLKCATVTEHLQRSDSHQVLFESLKGSKRHQAVIEYEAGP